jgi:hypothetical protein
MANVCPPNTGVLCVLSSWKETATFVLIAGMKKISTLTIALLFAVAEVMASITW